MPAETRSRLTIIHCVGGLDAEYGGPSRSVPELCRALGQKHEVHLLTGLRHDSRPPENDDDSLTLHYVNERRYLGRLTTYASFQRHLHAAVEQHAVSILHDHGIWLPYNHAAVSVAERLGRPLVISPRGMLMPEAFGSGHWYKRLAWRLYQRRDLRKAALLHLTSEHELPAIRDLGFENPCMIVPNGVDQPSPDRAAVVNQCGRRKTAIMMTRLHPIKNIEVLIHAWGQIRPTDWRLRIVGPGDSDYRASLVQMVDQLHLSDHVSIESAVSRAAKWAALEASSLFVMPSKSENFGLVVAEAMSAGLPVIATRGTPWRVLEEIGAGWWVEATAGQLADAIHDATSLPNEHLQAKGERGRVWVRQHLQWSSIADQMSQGYRWLLGGDQPDFVITD